ncbi:unnamed protein product [Psylliodes chrysocephalus]|uniref:Uncharacterized protein n=1 Tax=Psylliodes chrysocephalus TaxID=3402493 RepID=A0A9P0CWC2_9CUCU|nr:unnamed protein product [Psylliodes chrysocephala]
MASTQKKNNNKKYVENQNATGRGKKFFEYSEEMESILGKKKNIRPQTILENNTIDNIEAEINNIPEIEPETENIIPKTSSVPKSKSEIIKNKRVKRISNIEQMPIDRKQYFEKKIKLDEQKLLEIKRKNELIQERNQLIKEQNEILKVKECVGSLRYIFISICFHTLK